MDKILKTTESRDLLSLMPDEIMDIQGGINSYTICFDAIKKMVDVLIKHSGEPCIDLND